MKKNEGVRFTRGQIIKMIRKSDNERMLRLVYVFIKSYLGESPNIQAAGKKAE